MVGRPVSVGIFLALGAVAAIVGCSANNGNPIAPIISGTIPPSHAPTATPTPGTIGSSSPEDACAFLGLGGATPPPAVTLPGNYSLFISEGEVTGESYSQVLGEWAAFNVSGTPEPTPTPGPSSVPSATPVPSGTPFAYDIFTGTYSIPGFTVTPGPSAAPSSTPVAIAATVGCAIFIVSADRSTLGEVSPTASASEEPINAETVGTPNFGDGEDLFDEEGLTIEEIGEGSLTTFNLNNLTAAGGTATFTLDAGVSGNAIFGPQSVYNEAKLRQLKARIARARGMMFMRGR